MTTLHFTNARLIDPEAQSDALGTLTVEAGVIAALNGAAPAGAEVIDCGGHCLAPGIVDLGVKIGEPGERHRESFRSAGLAAAAGGVALRVEGQAIGGRDARPAGRWQAVGRTPGDLIVAVDVPDQARAQALRGTIQRVRVQDSTALLLRGALIGP